MHGARVSLAQRPVAGSGASRQEAKIAGFGHPEIAVRLGKTEANVRMLLSRVLARLTTALEAEQDPA